jgi:hypothetical protein
MVFIIFVNKLEPTKNSREQKGSTNCEATCLEAIISQYGVRVQEPGELGVQKQMFRCNKML